jgi:hypothetical protein
MWPELEADRLTTICEQIVQTMWDFQHLKTLQPTTACYVDGGSYLTGNTLMGLHGQVQEIVFIFICR